MNVHYEQSASPYYEIGTTYLPCLDPPVEKRAFSSIPSSTAGATISPLPAPTQAWTIESPPLPHPGILRRILRRIMCSCLNRIKCAHAWVKNTFGIDEKTSYYPPEPARISPPPPPADETMGEREERITRETRHMENLSRLRKELGGFTADTVIYHNTPDGDERVTYFRHRPKDVITPGSEPLMSYNDG